jgi:hypothetical protein
MSGFATWASWIFDLSSSVGSIVNSFCSNKSNVSVSHLWHQYPQQLSLCVFCQKREQVVQYSLSGCSGFKDSNTYYWLSLRFAQLLPTPHHTHFMEQSPYWKAHLTKKFPSLEFWQ